MSDKNQRAWRRIRLWAILALVSAIVSLLTSAFSVRRMSRLSQSKAELTRFESALAAFKARFGCLPPGHIELSECGEKWTTSSRRSIRRIWPQYDFDQKVDLNADGDTDDVHVLSGAECLVFFLGGVRVSGLPVGFGVEPGHPFREGSTVGPFYEFELDRFVDVDGDDWAEYVGPLPDQRTPILYSGPLAEGTFDPRVLDVFKSGSSRNMQSLYVDANDRFWKPNSYQLVNPGTDNEYGTGGLYDSESEHWCVSGREAERDNVTNFNEGLALGPTKKFRLVDFIEVATRCLFVFSFAMIAAELLIMFLRRESSGL